MTDKKKKTLDSITRIGIERWLRWSISRFSSNHKLVAKFEWALLEFQKGNYREAEWVMKRYVQPLRTCPKMIRLTRSQFTEKRVLIIWLGKLKEL